MSLRIFALLGVMMLSLAPVQAIHADPAPFDLAGPKLEVMVSRGGRILPISEVPNLASGDQIWIKADLPSTQAARYLLVAAFLRGSTNPPPESWFFPCQTWTRPCAQKGLGVTVPAGAQQVLIFLAPETGGDFKTLRNAVRGRPGAFVRASQDLNQATLDRSRLDAYLAAIRALNEADQSRLQQASALLGRSLAIKVDKKCLDRIPELQASCLMSGQDSLILNDGHSTSIVEALTSGPATDLAMEASYTPQLSYGYYSPYLASILDIARIMGSFHTAQYQYIPALTSQQGDQLALTLNTPPSFYNPKSVLVAALPAVEHAQLPPLHAVDPKEIYCARKTSLVLPVEGAPLVFSTRYAHDMTLNLTGADGHSIQLTANADAQQGGFVVDTAALKDVALGDSVKASLHGYWGFDAYDGPHFQLVNAHAQNWKLASSDAAAMIVGREETVHLRADSVSCIDGIMLRDPAGKELTTDWKAVKPGEVELKLPLQEADPGAMTLLVKQYGASQPQPVSLQAFSEAGHLGGFTFHAGDTQGVLRGSRLDKVASLSMKGAVFMPGKLSSSPAGDELPLVAQAGAVVSALKPGSKIPAQITLTDGRVLKLNVTVEAPRPRVTLIGKSVQPSSTHDASHIQLSDPDELPQDAKLRFSVRTLTPATFAIDEKIEVATADASISTTLGLDNGGITLGDAQVAIATLDPVKAFGSSAFGPLQFRVLIHDATGDWQPLATLVRLPVLEDLTCPASPELACKLSGSNLFLLESVSNDPQFAHPVEIPDGFPGVALPVPRPVDGRLYVKLRDDPSVINPATLAVQLLPPSVDDTARSAARHAAAPATAPVALPEPPLAPATVAPAAAQPVTVAPRVTVPPPPVAPPAPN